MPLPYFKSIIPPGDFTSLTRDDVAGSIPDRFNEIAAHNPQKTAICDHVKSLTYLELQRQVSKVAALIRRAIGPSTSAKGVALIFNATLESVVGILGVLASGNFFCPISPRDPPARVKFYLEDAEIDVIVTTREAFSKRLQSELQFEQVVFVDELTENDVEMVIPTTLNPHQLAAVLYTSGSARSRSESASTLSRCNAASPRKCHKSRSDPNARPLRLCSGSFSPFYPSGLASRDQERPVGGKANRRFGLGLGWGEPHLGICAAPRYPESLRAPVTACHHIVACKAIHQTTFARLASGS